MQLVEQHIINKQHDLFKEIDQLAFASKNLYNYANYVIRQIFIKAGDYINYGKLDKILQSHETYKALPAKVSQQVLRLLDKNWFSFFKAIKDWKTHPNKYLGKPKLPKYKHKENGRNILIYTIQAISKKQLKKGLISLSKTGFSFYSKVIETLQQVRIIPGYSYYVIEVVYEKLTGNKLNTGHMMSIDLGVNNLSAIFISNGETYLINGRPLKSVNQFYNKRKAVLMSYIGNKGTSNKIEKLTLKRHCKVKDYLHKASRKVIDIAKENHVSKIVIGHNQDWKQAVNMGKKNNQTFVNIPFKQFIDMIIYKAEIEGIDVILTEESYTSKIDHLANEKLGKQAIYLGKRVKRGLFKSSTGKTINSDLNGSLGILRKVVSNATEKFAKEIEGIVVFPKLVTI